MTKTSRRIAAASLAAVAVAAFGVLFTHRAAAREFDGFTITDENLSGEKEFPALPPAQNVSGQVSTPTLEDCKTLPVNHAVKITFAIRRDTPTKVTFTISWDSAGNDIDTYFFDSDGNQIGGAATGDQPERFNLGGLPNDDYWLCLVNFSGVNTGYTISVKANFLSLYEAPPPPPTAVPQRTRPPATPTPETTASALAPVVTPEAVDTPGPDGPTEDRELLAVDRQASPPDGGRSGVSVGLLAFSGLIVATGAGLVFVRIRRDTRIG